MAADVPALRATGRHGVRQAAPRRGAQLRLDAQAVDEATVFDSIVKNLLAQRRVPGVVFRQPQMVEILHADNQRCRRLSRAMAAMTCCSWARLAPAPPQDGGTARLNQPRTQMVDITPETRRWRQG